MIQKEFLIMFYIDKWVVISENPFFHFYMIKEKIFYCEKGISL